MYGAPRGQLDALGLVAGNVEICLQGECHTLDTATKYDAVEPGAPVLLWSANLLNPSHQHLLELHLLDTTQDRNHLHALTIHHIIYYDMPQVSP